MVMRLTMAWFTSEQLKSTDSSVRRSVGQLEVGVVGRPGRVERPQSAELPLPFGGRAARRKTE